MESEKNQLEINHKQILLQKDDQIKTKTQEINSLQSELQNLKNQLQNQNSNSGSELKSLRSQNMEYQNQISRLEDEKTAQHQRFQELTAICDQAQVTPWVVTFDLIWFRPKSQI